MASTQAQPKGPLKWKHSRAMVTVKDTAEALGVSPARVRELTDTNELDAWPVGGSVSGNASREHLRIIRSSAEAWFLENYLAKNGKEFPVENSEEIARYRRQLRDMRKQPSKRGN